MPQEETTQPPTRRKTTSRNLRHTTELSNLNQRTTKALPPLLTDTPTNKTHNSTVTEKMPTTKPKPITQTIKPEPLPVVAPSNTMFYVGVSLISASFIILIISVILYFLSRRKVRKHYCNGCRELIEIKISSPLLHNKDQRIKLANASKESLFSAAHSVISVSSHKPMLSLKSNSRTLIAPDTLEYECMEPQRRSTQADDSPYGLLNVQGLASTVSVASNPQYAPYDDVEYTDMSGRTSAVDSEYACVNDIQYTKMESVEHYVSMEVLNEYANVSQVPQEIQEYANVPESVEYEYMRSQEETPAPAESMYANITSRLGNSFRRMSSKKKKGRTNVVKLINDPLQEEGKEDEGEVLERTRTVNVKERASFFQNMMKLGNR